MTQQRPKASPPLPTLVAEFRLVVDLPGGQLVIGCDSEEEARWRWARIVCAQPGATSRIEQRHVSAWRAVSPPQGVPVDVDAGMRQRRKR